MYRTWVDLSWGSPLTIKPRNGSLILMYHGVDILGSKRFNLRHMPLSDFIHQLEWLHTHCQVVDLREIFSEKDREESSKPRVAITFDDAFRNVFKYAVPELVKRKLPATIFVTGVNRLDCDILWGDMVSLARTLVKEDVTVNGRTFRYVPGEEHKDPDSGESLSEVCHKNDYRFKHEMIEAFGKKFDRYKDELLDYWQLMSDDEIRKTADTSCVRIGSHAWYHNNLPNVPLEMAREELISSKNYLHDLVGYDIQTLAYPDGDYSPQLVDVAYDLGLTCQCTTETYIGDTTNDPRIRTRVGLYPAYSWKNQLNYAFRNAIHPI
ncbi:MAG: polysaccharide deacetylase family protein [Flavobacteriales bacterium]|nr:polysaccharide deacetylase family protein [Flavobacteriales bacterium]